MFSRRTPAPLSTGQCYLFCSHIYFRVLDACQSTSTPCICYHCIYRLWCPRIKALRDVQFHKRGNVIFGFFLFVKTHLTCIKEGESEEDASRHQGYFSFSGFSGPWERRLKNGDIHTFTYVVFVIVVVFSLRNTISESAPPRPIRRRIATNGSTRFDLFAVPRDKVKNHHKDHKEPRSNEERSVYNELTVTISISSFSEWQNFLQRRANQ